PIPRRPAMDVEPMVTIERPSHAIIEERTILTPGPQPVAHPAPLRAIVQQTAATETATAHAHEAYLQFADHLTHSMSEQLGFQISLLHSMLADPSSQAILPSSGASTTEEEVSVAGASSWPSEHGAHSPTAIEPVFLDRDQCLEFARGFIAPVLGP